MPKRKASDIATGDDKAQVASGIRRSSRLTNPAIKEEIDENVEVAHVKFKRVDKRGKGVKGESDGDDGVAEVKKKPSKAAKVAKPEENEESTGQQFWLMKAEPETRMEKGKDVRFSIDDLAAKNDPEPWDGIRNYVARNNLRAMKRGDLAFFYHSNCKVPGIVGIMEIVEEHSPDLTAQDPSQPYYDPKDKGPEPKWSVVHVVFRRKFEQQITLAELREWNAKGGPLEKMQMLTAARLSVSRVSKGEWEFLMGVVEEREGK